MPAATQPRFAANRLLGLTSSAAAALALAVLAGWEFDLVRLKSVSAEMVSMKPITAVALLICAAVLALQRRAPTGMTRLLAKTLAVVVIAVAAAILAEYVLGVDLVFERFLFSSQLRSPTPGRMAPNSAVCFLLLGTALLLVDSGRRHVRRAGDLCALVASVLALVAILGYLFDVTALYQISKFTGMALHTAFGFLLIATGVFLVRPEDGIFAFLVGDDAGAVLARRLLPPTAMVLVGMAVLLSIGERLGLYPARLFASLLVVTAMLVLAVLIAHSARLLQRLDFARRSAEEDVRRSERWFSTTLRSIGDAVIATDTEGHVLLINAVAEELTGWPQSEAAGKLLSQVFRTMNESTGRPVEDPVKRVLEKGKIQGLASHTVLLARDGGRVPIDDSAAAIRDASGQIIGVVLVFRDITARRQTEEALRVSEKLAATGRLAASIAHEINNPLEAVTNLLYLLQMDKGLDANAREYADAAQQELARVSHITKHTLRFYRDSTSPAHVRLADLLEDVLTLYARRIGQEQIRVRKRFDIAGEIEGLAGELRQIFSNLLVNALDAAGHKGEVVLHVTPGRNWRTGEFGVRVAVADNGRGIPPELRHRIFRPFFSTKGDRGTGLGLWVSAGIADRHHGCIRVHSSTRPGRSGTCFVVWLPASAVVFRARAAG